MGRKSKISALPEPVRREVDRLINSGLTLDDVLAHLRKLAADGVVPAEAVPARSSVGRYAQTFEQTAKKIREAREIAAGIVEKLGIEQNGDVGRLLMEMLRTIAFQTLGDLGEIGADARDVMFLAKAIRDLEGAGKVGYEQRMIERKAAVQDAVAKVEEVVERAVQQKVVTRETRDMLMADFLGIKV